MTVRREVKESPTPQGIHEEIIYSLDTLPWGGTPTNPVITVFLVEDGEVYTDAEDDVMPVNEPSVDGDDIILSPLKDLTIGERYRVEINFTVLGNVEEAFGLVDAER